MTGRHGGERLRSILQCAQFVVLLSFLQPSLADGAKQVTANNLHITSVTLSPDGKTFATGGADAFTRLWDVATGKIRYTAREDRGGITALAFSAEGRSVATGSSDSRVNLYDASSGKVLLQSSVGGDGVQGRAGNSILSLAFSPDGERIVSGGTDYKVRVMTVEEGRQELVLAGHRGPVKSVSFSADGRMVLSVGGDGSGGGCVKWWNLPAGTEAGTICSADYLIYAAFTPDGSKVFTAGGQALKLWDIHQRKQLVTLEHGGYVDCAALSHNGHLALSAGGDGVIKVWDVVTGRLVRKLEGHAKSVFSVSFSSDDRIALSGDGGGTIKLWNLTTGAEIRTFPAARSNIAVAFALPR